ncbi:MAG: 5-formyltetrahydrofolate cyclo-ligase [Oscillospiraceae bacterium]|jgi:5-formyltetrahydrofolate cyclo-ligase|nr:5-formyltetrahydrofolate cyclo-ligase [Oscillospiraceae bacterium]
MPIRDTDTEKKLLRRELLARRAAFAPERKRAADEAICLALRDVLENHALVLAFYPIGSEPNLLPALRAFHGQVYLPKCTPDAREMTFYAVEDWDGLRPGAYGIPEPRAALPARHATLCLTPGLAFDREGYRLGYGGGYYDRFLAGFSGESVGVCYEAFFMERLPRGAFDRPVGRVLTERGWAGAAAE